MNDNPTSGQTPTHRSESSPAPQTAGSGLRCSPFIRAFTQPLTNAGVRAEWGDILRDLNALSETTITYNGKSFAVRSNVVGVAGKIAQCVGVRLPNTVRQIEFEEGNTDPGS